MTALTAQDLLAVLEPLVYPYPIRFYTYIPKFPIYPYVTIRKQPPVSNTEDVTDINQTDGFEVTLYIRYTKLQQDEEVDQTTIETTILNAVENTDFGTSAVYFETRNWNRVPIPRLYGSQSRLKILVTDKISASGEGVFGSQLSLQTALGNIKILSMTTVEGVTIEKNKNDLGEIFNDFAGLNFGDITFEYESNSDNNTTVKALTDGDNHTVTLVKGNQTFDMIVLFGATTKRGQYDKVERATTGFAVQSIVDSVRADGFSVDAILI